jgi:hypothetical protein
LNFDDVLENDDNEQLPAVADTGGPLEIPNLDALLTDKRVRSVEDVLDYASTCALAVAKGGVPTKLSKELRLWGELMYSCVQTQNIVNGDGGMNFIGQLIQIAGNPEAPTLAQAAKAIDVEPEETPIFVPEKVAANE